MGFFDGNNALGNWFYNRLQSNVNNDPYLRNEVYNAGSGSTTAAVGSVFKLPELGISEAQAASLPEGLDGGGGGGGGGGTGDDGTVLGTKTSDGGGGGTNPTGGTTGGTQPSAPSYEDIMRSQISSGYSNYFGQLDQMLGGLGTEKTARENIANTSANQNIEDLLATTNQNVESLGKEKTKTESAQVKSLADISNNLRNLMQAGNTYLGARGAGDSSAVPQYAYAVTKLGSQQRGDVVSQTRNIIANIDDKITNVKNIFTQEKARIKSDLSNKIQEIAIWFSDAQRQIQQAKASGELSKSTDLQNLSTNLYNAALTQLTNIQNFATNRQAMLEEWAANNSTSLSQLKQNLSSIGSFVAPQVGYSNISGTPTFDAQGNMSVPYGGSGITALTEEQKRLLGLA